MRWLILWLLVSALTMTRAEQTTKKLYNGFQMIRTEPSSPEELSLVESLEEAVVAWTPVVSLTKTSIDLTVAPNFVGVIKQLLRAKGVHYTTAILDIQNAIDMENVEATGVPSFRGGCSTKTGMSWSKYHDYNTILSFVNCLGETYNEVKVHYLGTSTEGRAIKVVELGKGNKKIWIDGGIHAREWISPASVSFILRALAEESHNYQDILNSFTFFISPSINPDGYEYSRNSDRMWRKTRGGNRSGACAGVDPNRNFGYHWGGKGTSTNPCSEIYKGTYAFSEPETRAVKDFIMSRSGWQMYLTFHSYGQMILYPWGYERLDHSQESELKRLGNVAARAMSRGYTVGSAAKVLYPAAGGSDDWAFGGAKIPYSYTFELPDTGTHGFILPASYIHSVGQDSLEATLAMARDLSGQSLWG